MSAAQSREDGEPPRKRLNRGGSPADPADLFNVPDSPDVQRLGARRKTNNNALLSSDESLPEIDKDVAGPSKPRLTRGPPSEVPTSVPSTPSMNSEATNDSESKFIRFKIVNQFENSEARIRAAWQQANEDVRKATELLQDRNFMAHPPPSSPSAVKPKPTRPTVETGRVKELEEASKAERARVKEMGKKSAIYSALTTSTPPVSKANGEKSIPPPTPATPGSPEVARPRVKRVKRKIVDSDSEAEFSGSDNEKRISRRESTSEEDALAYFNTSSAEALQELTGMLCLMLFALCSLYTRMHAGASSEDS